MKCENFDDGVERAWQRCGRSLQKAWTGQKFYWGALPADPLLYRQVYMMREGRHSLHNMIRGAHNLPNRY